MLCGKELVELLPKIFHKVLFFPPPKTKDGVFFLEMLILNPKILSSLYFNYCVGMEMRLLIIRSSFPMTLGVDHKIFSLYDALIFVFESGVLVMCSLWANCLMNIYILTYFGQWNNLWFHQESRGGSYWPRRHTVFWHWFGNLTLYWCVNTASENPKMKESVVFDSIRNEPI